MKRSISEKMLPLAMPAGLVAMACVLLLKIPSFQASSREMFKYFSYGVFFTALVLSYWFNRSKIFFVAVILAASQLVMIDLPPAGKEGISFGHSVYIAASLLIPANILAFSLAGERGIISGRGKARASLALVQVLFLYWAGVETNSSLIKALDRNIFSAWLSGFTPIPQLSVIIFMAALFIMITRLLLKPTPMEGSFIGVLLASALALHLRDTSMAVPVYFTAAGAIMAIAVLQDSYRKAYLDDLTGLPGRRALTEELEKLEGKYCIAMLDIDFFKKFNDTYGHDIGDEVLKLIAAVIRSVTGGGKPFRYGGEEFTILFPGQRLSQVVPHLEDLRERIAGRAFIMRELDRPRKKPSQVSPSKAPRRKIQITVSIGVSESGGRLRMPGEVLKAADEALYRAKEQGRNRVSRG